MRARGSRRFRASPHFHESAPAVSVSVSQLKARAKSHRTAGVTTEATTPSSEFTGPALVRARTQEEGQTLSKISIDQEPGVADTFLDAELDETHTAPTFAELGVRDEIVRALAERGIDRTFAIQELTLPLALGGEDLIGQARTGMGKTYGFGVPLLHRITSPEQSGTAPLDGTPRALVIVPTRELCLQVTGDLEDASRNLSGGTGKRLSVLSIYGGRPYETQINALRDGRRRGRRHPGTPARPRQPGPPDPRQGRRTGARRGRRDAGSANGHPASPLVRLHLVGCSTSPGPTAGPSSSWPTWSRATP